MDVKRFLAFSDAVAARAWARYAEIPEDVLAEKVDYSFLTPLGILTHAANVENAWMDVVEGDAPNWARHSTKTWSTLAPVREYAEAARARTHRLVDDLDDAGLQRECGPVDGAFARKSFTVEEIVFTILTHEHVHRGEVHAALWRRDLEPPPVDWPTYGSALR